MVHRRAAGVIARLAAAAVVITAVLVGGHAHAQAPRGEAAGIDYAAELRIHTPLAQQGNAVAQFNLGVMNDFGHGIPKDAAKAVYWYRLAAAQGHASAQFNLGGMYFEGLGVPRDLVRASMWFTLSAQAGIPGAAKNRAVLARALSPAQRVHAQTMARECLEREFQQCE